jgi:hypothetical protein
MSKASILKTAPLYVVWEISFPALMMEAASPCEVHFFQTIWQEIPENSNLHSQQHDCLGLHKNNFALEFCDSL